MAEGIDCIRLGQYQEFHKRRVFACSIHGRTTLDACRTCLDHTRYSEFPQFELAGVIQTTPHRQQYFQRSFKTFMKACNHIEQQIDSPPSGAFPAFVMAITRLFYRHPHASAYLYLQDDTILKDYTAKVLSKELPTGYMVASLYNPPSLRDFEYGVKWQQVDAGWNSPGACCYVFSPAGIRSLLRDPYLQWHRMRGATNGTRCIDSVVGVWAAEHGGIWYRKNPLATHLGVISSIDRSER